MTSRGHRRMRKLKEEWREARRQPCMRCGQPIDYDAPPEDPNSFNLGHIVAWAHSVELRMDPGNLQQEHASCGKSAGTRRGDDRDLGMTSGLL